MRNNSGSEVKQRAMRFGNDTAQMQPMVVITVAVTAQILRVVRTRSNCIAP